jgi:ribosomal protein S2
LEFRERIVNDFTVVFEGTDKEEEKFIVSETFAEKWSWFGVMYRLTGGEIVNLEKVTKLNVLECFTWLSYEVDLEQQNKVKYDSNKQIV